MNKITKKIKHTIWIIGNYTYKYGDKLSLQADLLFLDSQLSTADISVLHKSINKNKKAILAYNIGDKIKDISNKINQVAI